MRETFFEAHSYINWYASREFEKIEKEILFRSDFDLNWTAHIFFLLRILLTLLVFINSILFLLENIFRFRPYLFTIITLYYFFRRFKASCHPLPHPFEYVEM